MIMILLRIQVVLFLNPNQNSIEMTNAYRVYQESTCGASAIETDRVV